MTAEDSEYIERCVNVRAWQLVQICRTPELLDDYRQELRIAVFRRLDRFDPSRASLRTYCDRVVHSAARLLLRRHKRAVMLAHETTDRGRHTRNTQLTLDISAMIAELPEHLQQVVADMDAGKSCRRMSTERASHAGFFSVIIYPPCAVFAPPKGCTVIWWTIPRGGHRTGKQRGARGSFLPHPIRKNGPGRRRHIRHSLFYFLF